MEVTRDRTLSELTQEAHTEDSVLRALADGRLGEPALAKARAHLLGCPQCAAKMGLFAAGLGLAEETRAIRASATALPGSQAESHATEATLRALAEGALGDASASVANEHLRQCKSCSEKFELLKASLLGADATRGPPPSTPSTTPPVQSGVVQRIGPYILLEQLGEGGMGTVYAAYHKDLDRGQPAGRRSKPLASAAISLWAPQSRSWW